MAPEEQSSTPLLRRPATRRTFIAGGVAAAGVAGAYAALGDPLRLLGDQAAPEGTRSDTAAIKKESVRVNHLMRRAGFGATPQEYERYQQLGLQATTDELLAYDAMDDSEAEASANAAADATRGQLASPAFAWLARLANTKRPLQEKMTLFWHGLLTSQLSVVTDPGAMAKQVDFYRTHALDRFPDILKGISMDAAMMTYLNIANSARGAPNENYARELMELFALGVGNFSEQDVREASRAFTGWQVPRQRADNGFFELGEPVFRPQRFDNGTKTLFGKTGNFGPDEVVDLVTEQPASARYITGRLFSYFVYPNPSDADLKPFVEAYLKSDKSVRSVVEAILRSDVFYSPKAYRALIKSPVEYAVGAIKAIGAQERVLSLVSGGQRRGGVVGDMGQILYEPPNVAGWPGNEAWINASTMFARLNFLNALTGGGPQQQRQRQPVALDAGSTSIESATAAQALTQLLPLALDDNVSAEMQQVLFEYAGGPDAQLTREQVSGLAYLVLAAPQFHLS